jgi:hypothetical protein
MLGSEVSISVVNFNVRERSVDKCGQV